MSVWQSFGDGSRTLAFDWSWLQPRIVEGIGDYVFFRFVLQRLEHDIEALGTTLLGNVMQFVSYLALTIVTLWVLIQGYKVVTGQLRESMMGMMANMAKTVFIVAVALSFGAVNDRVTTFLTTDMKDGIHELVTGNAGGPESEIDRNLGWLQVALSSMDVLESGGDVDGAQEKERAATLIQLGTGGPPIVAGTLLLMYQVAMALFIGLGPIFILCLLFESTKSMFMRWLMYGIGTMFSMALLSAMVSIALNMVSDLAVALWASDALTTLFLPGAEGSTGFSSRAMQSGAMGMILTLLLITVPPLAANFFGGTLGQFTAYATMGSHLAPGGGQPQMGAYSGLGGMGVYGGQPPQPRQDHTGDSGVRTAQGDLRTAQTDMYSTGGTGRFPPQDTGIRQGSGWRDQVSPDANVSRYATGPALGSPPGHPSGPTTQPTPPPKESTPPRS